MSNDGFGHREYKPTIAGGSYLVTKSGHIGLIHPDFRAVEIPDENGEIVIHCIDDVHTGEISKRDHVLGMMNGQSMRWHFPSGKRIDFIDESNSFDLDFDATAKINQSGGVK